MKELERDPLPFSVIRRQFFETLSAVNHTKRVHGVIGVMGTLR